MRGLAEALARPLVLARLPSTFSQRLADSTSFVASVALFLLLVKRSASDMEMLAAHMEILKCTALFCKGATAITDTLEHS